MIKTRTRVGIEVAVTAILLVIAGYWIGTSALVVPWVLAGGCGIFVIVMWTEAWKLRANPQASIGILDLALGVAGMFVLLALQMSRLAEHGQIGDPDCQSTAREDPGVTKPRSDLSETKPWSR